MLTKVIKVKSKYSYYWYFDNGFKFQRSVGNSCHEISMITFRINNMAIIIVKRLVIIGCVICCSSKSDYIYMYIYIYMVLHRKIIIKNRVYIYQENLVKAEDLKTKDIKTDDKQLKRFASLF